jgi:hypothetical protein
MKLPVINYGKGHLPEYHNVRICTVSAYDHMVIGKMKEKGKKKEGKCQNKMRYDQALLID